MSNEPTLRLTEKQLRLVVCETSVAYARALRRESVHAAEQKRTRALELALLEIAEGENAKR